MKFTIEKRGEKWAVLSADGKLLSEHATTDEAMSNLAVRMTEAATQIAEESRGARFRASFLEGEDTRDVGMVRRWEPGATRFERETIPLMLMTENPITGGHAGARLAGSADVQRRDGENLIVIEGHYDLGSEAGKEGQRLLEEGVLTTMSPDFGDMTWEEEVLEFDDDNFPVKFLLRVTDAVLIGITQTPMQALDSAKIELVAAGTADAEETETETETAEEEATVTASGAPMKPPAEWFEDPQLSELTPLTITDEGKVFGHAAAWGQCHIGFSDRCVTPPTSASAYAYFQKGALTADGCDCDLAIGVVTMDTGHADLQLDAAAAAAHYDNTGFQAADIVVGEDEHGIWVSGAVRPDVDELRLRKLKASALSGDWRPIGTGLELVALLAVNVAGYPITRTRVASGKQTALVAAGGLSLAKAQEERLDPTLQRIGDLEKRMKDVEVIATAVRPVAASALRDRAR